MQFFQTYTFDNHHDGLAFMRQHKPPFGTKWSMEHIQIDENEYSEAVTVSAIDKWPIGHPNFNPSDLGDLSDFIPGPDEP